MFPSTSNVSSGCTWVRLRFNALAPQAEQQTGREGMRETKRERDEQPPPPLLVINEFVLSGRPASCQPRSLLIKLALANVLNTD